jgi:hypothetical protein
MPWAFSIEKTGLVNDTWPPNMHDQDGSTGTLEEDSALVFLENYYSQKPFASFVNSAWELRQELLKR